MTVPSHPPLKVALLGAGNVGSQVARIITEDAELLASRVGARLELVGVGVRTLDAERAYRLPAELYTTGIETLVDSADIVVELMGGIEPARTLVLRALERGAGVVTGNKALLAKHGPELFAAAAEAGVQLSFEASVAGAIPILRPLRDSLSGDRVTRIMGIANGTTNFILDQMDTTGAAFDEALAQAQQLGYAEADPTADVEGHDAAAKAAILGMLAFRSPFSLDQVHCEGITSISAADNEAATEAGYVIKLLAIVERVRCNQGTGDAIPAGATAAGTTPAGGTAAGGTAAADVPEGAEVAAVADGVVLRVHPTLLPRQHPLAAVHGAFNAVYVEAENAGQLMFYGPGAGGAPTASAVMGDVVSIGRRLVRGGPGRIHALRGRMSAVEIGQSRTSYLVVVQARDEPGVLARIASVFAENGVSIEAMRQVPLTDQPVVPGQTEGAAEGPAEASLRFITHRAPEKDLARTVEVVKGLDVVTEVVSVLRVEGN